MCSIFPTILYYKIALVAYNALCTRTQPWLTDKTITEQKRTSSRKMNKSQEG